MPNINELFAQLDNYRRQVGRNAMDVVQDPGQAINALQGVPMQMLNSISGGAYTPEQIALREDSQSVMPEVSRPAMQQRVANAMMGFGTGGIGPHLPINALGQTVYHGSPHLFEKFDLSHAGTGEGSAYRGEGAYVGEHPDTGAFYRDVTSREPNSWTATHPEKGELANAEQMRKEYFKPGRIVQGYAGKDEVISYQPGQYGDKYRPWSVTVKQVEDPFGRKPPYYERERTHGTEPSAKNLESVLSKEGWQIKKGHLYKIDLPDEHIEKMIDLDKTMAQQPDVWKLIRRQADKPGLQPEEDVQAHWTGDDVRRHLETEFGGDQAKASQRLLSLGIPGSKFLDQYSRTPPQRSLQELQAGLKQAEAALKDPPKHSTDRFIEITKGNIDSFKKQIANYPKQTRNFVVFDDKLLKILGRE